MPRAIPCDVPDELAELIYEGWGDMKSFAIACGLPYTTIYSVLRLSTHTKLDRLATMAQVLGVELEQAAEIFLAADSPARRSKLLETCSANGLSISEFCRRSNISRATIHNLLNGKTDTYRSYVVICRHLKVSLKYLQRIFKEAAA